MTFDEAERALDAGKLEMQRPWGDYVPVRRRYRTTLSGISGRSGTRWRMIEVWMEAEVVASISEAWDGIDQPGLRIVP